MNIIKVMPQLISVNLLVPEEKLWDFLKKMESFLGFLDVNIKKDSVNHLGNSMEFKSRFRVINLVFPPRAISDFEKFVENFGKEEEEGEKLEEKPLEGQMDAVLVTRIHFPCPRCGHFLTVKGARCPICTVN